MNIAARVHKVLLLLPKPAAHWGRLFGLAVLTGVLAGLAAASLEWGLGFGNEHLVGRVLNLGGAEVLRFNALLLVLPAIGCMGSRGVVDWLVPRTSGHGTELLVRAFHREAGRLPLRAPLVNAIGCIGVISCGGSAGPEGPMAALGAAIGSTLGRVFAVTPRERRVMLIAGCGAGVGAIFQCPLGGALFAAGILYRDPDFETDAIVPAFIASVISYSTYMPFWGYGEHLLSGAERLTFASPWELVPYALLGPLCALLCLVFRVCLRGVEHLSARAPRLPRWVKAGLGGLATGTVACILPQVMDNEYVFVQKAMDGTLLQAHAAVSWWSWAALFILVAIAKCLATALTVGCGAPGGLLGPSVFIGGTVGACLSALVEAAAPGLFPMDLRWALVPVGMAGVLSATMRAPLASMVMVTEMTGSYGLIVPLMLVCISAYVLGRRWGLNDEQVRSSADSPAHAGDAILHMLESWRVQDLMQPHWPTTVRPESTLRELVEMARPGTRPVFAVVDGERFYGVISLADIQRIMDETVLSDVVVAADIMSTEGSSVCADDDVYVAVTRMVRSNLSMIPVVARSDRGRFLGMLTRFQIYEAIQKEINTMREHLLTEHEGLAAIDSEDRLNQLVLGVPVSSREVVQRLLVPIDAIGQSLRESDLRGRLGIHVLAIEQSDGSIRCPPDPEAPLQPNQRLLAIVQQPEPA